MSDDSISFFDNEEEPQEPQEPEKPKNQPDPLEPQSTFADEEPKPKRGDMVIHDRSWQEIWQMAITSPTLETYEDILRDRVVTVARGAIWVLIAYTLSYAVSSISQVIFGNVYSFGQDTGGFNGFGLIGIICAPFIAAFAVGVWLVITAFNHFIAKYLLNGQGSYDQLVFSLAAYIAPITIISGLANFVPFVGLCVSGALGLYSLYLAVVAMNATHQFGWGKAILASYIIPILFICAICGCLFIVLAASGAAIQDVFDSILTPTPVGR